jgi:hypothetical protein
MSSDAEMDGDQGDGSEDPTGAVAGTIGGRRDGQERKPDEERGLAVILEVIGGIGGDVAESGEEFEGGFSGVLGGEGEVGGVGIEEGMKELGRVGAAEMDEVGEIDALPAVMRAGVETGAIGKTRLETLEKGLEDHGRRDEERRWSEGRLGLGLAERLEGGRQDGPAGGALCPEIGRAHV